MCDGRLELFGRCPHCCCCFCRDGAEQLSVDRALRALSRAEVVVMVVDGSDGVTQQVRRVGDVALSAGAVVR